MFDVSRILPEFLTIDAKFAFELMFAKLPFASNFIETISQPYGFELPVVYARASISQIISNFIRCSLFSVNILEFNTLPNFTKSPLSIDPPSPTTLSYDPSL